MSVALQQLLPDRQLPSEIAALAVSDLQLDSRRVRPGELFVAVPGEHTDGRRYTDDAIAAGASVVLMESDGEMLESRNGVPVIGVPGLRDGLGALAERFFGDSSALLIAAVTGTNGKTSTTWFLRDALIALGHRCGVVGTLGAHFGDRVHATGMTSPDVITLHRVLARLRDEGADSVTMEASSHALAQNRLDGVSIPVGVFTNLTHDHLDYHGEMESYYGAKALLFQRPEMTLAVINRDDPYGMRLIRELESGMQVLSCSQSPDSPADILCREFSADADGMSLSITVQGETVDVRLPLYGRFNLDNVLCVAGVLSGQGHDGAEVAQGLAALKPVPGRMEPVSVNGGPRVLVDYAHTPDALEKALQAVREHFSGRLHCVIGCGGDRDTAKRPLMAAVAEKLADRVVFTADNPRSESPRDIIDDMLAGTEKPEAVLVETDRRQAIRLAVARAEPDDVVLVAGKGHEGWQEVGDRRIPMDDRDLVREALVARGGAR